MNRILAIELHNFLGATIVPEPHHAGDKRQRTPIMRVSTLTKSSTTPLATRATPYDI